MGKTLSDREFNIVEHLVYFGTKKEAAPNLGITERTLETHTKNIFRKLCITKLNELVLWYCGVKFNIASQIEATKRNVIPITKKIAGIILPLLLIASTSCDLKEFQRCRRYRREVETEQRITFAQIGNK